MLRAIVLAVFAMSAIGVSDAAAMSITLTSPAIPIVVRPATGTVTVDFTGTIALDPGFVLTPGLDSSVETAGGDSLGFPVSTGNQTGTLFTLTVASTDALGLYAFQVDHVTPAFISFTECPTAVGVCTSASVDEGVDVVASLPAAVPEPASMLLVGTGLVGVGARRWRNRRQSI